MASAIVPYDTNKASTPEMALVVKTSEQEGRLGNMLESVKAQVQEVMLSMRQGASLTALCSDKRGKPPHRLPSEGGPANTSVSDTFCCCWQSQRRPGRTRPS